MLELTAGQARFCALLTPQGKIIVDFIVVAAPAAQGGGFLLDVPRALTASLVQKLNLYKLRSRVMVEDLSETLGVIAAWDGHRRYRKPVGRGSASPTPIRACRRSGCA